MLVLLRHEASQSIDIEHPILPPKEIVKKTTSSKKVDAPPPSADKSKAKKNKKPSVTGNEAGLKFKNKNPDVEPPKSTERRTAKSKNYDRHSKSGKTETAKSQKTKLGDEVEAQIEAEADAAEELAAEEEEEAEKPVYKTLDDYFSELQLQQEGLAAQPKRAPNAGAEDKWSNAELLVKEREVFIPPTSVKQTKQKAKKAKQYVDVDVIVADEVRVPRERPARSNNTRGRGRAPRGKAPKSAAPKIELNDKNFPAL
ncbi:hypothetical protein KL916_001179 [Ogataea parapolymorpha]|nr:hypothetical protein KL916_001179 [Ogataea parapolymorpha]